jgi:hypothetical protein
MSYDSASLTTPDISKWLIMRFSCRHFIASDFDTIVLLKNGSGCDRLISTNTTFLNNVV